MYETLPSSSDVFTELSKRLPKLIPNLCGIEVRKAVNVQFKGVDYAIRVSCNDQLLHLQNHLYTYNALERDVSFCYDEMVEKIVVSCTSNK